MLRALTADAVSVKAMLKLLNFEEWGDLCFVGTMAF